MPPPAPAATPTHTDSSSVGKRFVVIATCEQKVCTKSVQVSKKTCLRLLEMNVRFVCGVVRAEVAQRSRNGQTRAGKSRTLSSAKTSRLYPSRNAWIVWLTRFGGSGACRTVLFDTNDLYHPPGSTTLESSSGVRSGVSVELSWFKMRWVALAPISVRSRPSGDA